MIEPMAKILKIFHNNGLFNEGVELIGSWCFHLYQKHLGSETTCAVHTAETTDEKMNNSVVVY